MLIYGQPTVFGCMTVQAEKTRTSTSLSAVQSYDHKAKKPILLLMHLTINIKERTYQGREVCTGQKGIAKL